jgi:hypothetical protein
LSSLHDKTVNVNVVTHKSGGFAGGPAAAYYSAFASGGISDRELQRANERAVRKEAGPSQKVNRPTMLVGEQAPSHPEYVIATNPAFRASNERYLEDAAGDLGYEVVPAYAKGKGKKKGGKGGGNKGPGPAPYKPQMHGHHKVEKHRFAPGAVSELNTDENQLQNIEGKFNAELKKEEQEIAHKRRTEWDFATLKGFLNREEDIQREIIGTLIPHIAKASQSAYATADKELKGPLSAKKVHQAQHTAAKLSKEYSTMHAPSAPSKKTGESEKDYEAKKANYTQQKKHYEEAKARKKADAKTASNYAKQLEGERAAVQKVKEDAAAELKEVRQEVLVEHETALKEIQTETTNVEEIEANPELAPYYESAGGAGSKPTIGEETATISAEREKLYNEYGSNITAGGGNYYATGGGGTAKYGAGAHTTAATTGPDGYVTAALGKLLGGRSTSGGGTDTVSGGTVNHITNNFAAPPPDAHTWTKNQQFELGALA